MAILKEISERVQIIPISTSATEAAFSDSFRLLWCTVAGNVTLTDLKGTSIILALTVGEININCKFNKIATDGTVVVIIGD